MQDVDRPADIQRLPQPAGAGRAGVEAEPLRGMARPKELNRICGYHGRRWDVGQRSPVRPPEMKRAVGPARDLVALLVHRAVMPATGQREVRERGRATVRPVPDVMPLADGHAATREAASPVPCLERPPERGRNF